MASGKVWTAQELQHLRSLRKEGKSMEECASLIGRTVKACMIKLYTHKRQVWHVKKKGVVLTEEQIQWLKDNYSDTTNYNIEKTLGIGACKLNHLARRYGLRKSDEFIHKAAKRASAAAKRSHLENGTYRHKGTPAPHDKGFQKGVNNLMRLGPEREKRRIANSVTALAARREKERQRLAIGLPQKTKLKVVKEPPMASKQRYLLKKKGYTVDPDDRRLMHLPQDASKRSLRMERTAAKYGLRFDSPECLGKVDPSNLDISKLKKAFSAEKVFKEKKQAEPDERLYAVSSDIVRSLKAYANDKSVLY